jgi:hypothetical protein
VQWAASTFRDAAAQLRPAHIAYSFILDDGRRTGLRLVSGHPDINSECLKIGAALMFCLDHLKIP